MVGLIGMMLLGQGVHHRCAEARKEGMACVLEIPHSCAAVYPTEGERWEREKRAAVAHLCAAFLPGSREPSPPSPTPPQINEKKEAGHREGYHIISICYRYADGRGASIETRAYGTGAGWKRIVRSLILDRVKLARNNKISHTVGERRPYVGEGCFAPATSSPSPFPCHTPSFPFPPNQ
jgi:hypothetical protein